MMKKKEGMKEMEKCLKKGDREWKGEIGNEEDECEDLGGKNKKEEEGKEDEEKGRGRKEEEEKIKREKGEGSFGKVWIRNR